MRYILHANSVHRAFNYILIERVFVSVGNREYGPARTDIALQKLQKRCLIEIKFMGTSILLN